MISGELCCEVAISLKSCLYLRFLTLAKLMAEKLKKC